MPESRKIFVPVNDDCIDCNQKVDPYGGGYVVYDPYKDEYKRQCIKCHYAEKSKADEFAKQVYQRKRQDILVAGADGGNVLRELSLMQPPTSTIGSFAEAITGS